MGMRKGMGRGMGMGMGMRAGSPNFSDPITSSASREETLSTLKRQAEDLRQQMEAIQAKIDRIE
jgi:hypothetical protein